MREREKLFPSAFRAKYPPLEFFGSHRQVVDAAEG
jgi:hypothetical protein